MMVDSDASTRDDRARATDLVEAAIAQHWPGARCGGFGQVPGDASSRRYLRCSIEPADGGSTGLKSPNSLVVMLMEDASVAMSSDELGVFGADGPKELPFTNIARFLSRHTEALPAIYAAAEDSNALVLEDIGDLPLWEAASNGDPEAWFARALEVLATIQTQAVDDGSGCYAFDLAFDEELFGWEFEHFLEFGIRDPSAAATSACQSELQEAAKRLGALPRVFCHRDYHAWNIHVQGGKSGESPRIRIIDFQDALMGPHLYDVASLLTDRCTPELIDPQREGRLLAGYARALAKADPKTPYSDPAKLEQDYGLCALQRALKVIGRFNYLAEVKGKMGYSRFLPSEIATARRAVRRLPQMSATAAILADNVKGE
jgi:aminoglycoside/choline kinase family phosphotransferase